MLTSGGIYGSLSASATPPHPEMDVPAGAQAAAARQEPVAEAAAPGAAASAGPLLSDPGGCWRELKLAPMALPAFTWAWISPWVLEG